MRLTLAIVLLCAGVLAAPVCADVFERDLVPGSGDGLLTFDDVNQREWLDLTQTFTAEFPGGFGGVLDELAPGGIYAGFQTASRADVIALAESAGIDTTTLDPETNLAATENLIALLEMPSIAAAGFTNEISPEDGDLFVSVFYGSSSPRTPVAGLFFGTRSSSPGVIGDRLIRVTGVMLYREIPEPNAVVLICTGVLALSCQRVPRMRA